MAKPRDRFPKLGSSLTDAFKYLSGGWRSYLRFVKLAADDGSKPMKTLWERYESLSKTRRNSVTPEELCSLADVRIDDLLVGVIPWMWKYSTSASSIIAATANPEVIKRTAKSAMGAGRNSHKDRETFLKVSGALPTARGSNTTINNNQVAQVAAAPIGGLVSAGRDVLEMEEVDQIEDGD